MKNQLKGFSFKTFLLIIVLAFSTQNFSFAQQKSQLFSTDKVTLKSTNLNEDRTISIFLPADYKKGDNSYPVLYLLDGRTHFQHAIGAANYLSRQGIIPNVIIVSVHNIDRNKDFSPVYHESVPTSGGADKFLNFLTDELAVYINENYRASDFLILFGHSFGGTFAAHSLLKNSELFDAYIAVSPYLHYADNYLVTKAKEKTDWKENGHRYFFMSVGNEPPYFAPLKEFSATIKEKAGNSVNFKYAKMESEDHATTPYLTMFNGLKFIFSDYRLTRELFAEGLSTIDKHCKMVSEKYGLKIQTPENVINMLGYTKMGENDFDVAIKILKENVKRYPKSANVYDSLGEAYEKNNQLSLAKKNYKKACEIGKKTGDVNLPVYQKNLLRVDE